MRELWIGSICLRTRELWGAGGKEKGAPMEMARRCGSLIDGREGRVTSG